MSKSHRLLGGVVLLYFIIALEVLIMISPFAVFFYAAFDPFLLFLAKVDNEVSSWVTACSRKQGSRRAQTARATPSPSP